MANQAAQGMLSPFLCWRRLAAARPFLTGRVFDFGCGGGRLAAFCAPDHYLGYDQDGNVLEAARHAFPRHRFEPAVPENGSFDTVVLLAVIEHVEDPAALLSSLAGLLAPAGRLVLTTPHPRWEIVHEVGAALGIFSSDAAEEHHSLLNRDALQALAAASGLRLVEYRRFLLGANQLAVFERT
jgi:SAM-dependent methyltransferase